MTPRIALFMRRLVLAVLPAQADALPPAVRGDPIIIRPFPTEAECHQQLRDCTREVIYLPRMRQWMAKFAFPVAGQFSA